MATGTFSGKVDPVVQKISIDDVVESLIQGLRDFKAAPRYGLILGSLCALIGLTVTITLFVVDMAVLAYPVAAGFALICPSLSAVLYEISRRLETNEPITGATLLKAVTSRSEVRWMGFMTVFVFIMWMYQVRLLLALFLGSSGIGPSLTEFIHAVLTTTPGLTFLLIGNVIGAMLATLLFSLSVVSFPLVLDRDVDFVTAMVTSVRAVTANPKPMFFFAIIIVALLVISTLTAFVGLALTMPILGHATWHLYRKAVAPYADDHEAKSNTM